MRQLNKDSRRRSFQTAEVIFGSKRGKPRRLLLLKITDSELGKTRSKTLSTIQLIQRLMI